MHKFAGVVLFFISFNFFGQLEEAKRITAQLCAPEFHGRGYVNKGDSLAADFLAKEFEKAGIQPYKNQSYFQTFAIEGVNRFPDKLSLIQGEHELTPGIHFVVNPTSDGIKGNIDPYYLDPTQLLADDSLILDQAKIGLFFEQLTASGKQGIVIHSSKLRGDSLNAIAGLANALTQYHPIIEIVDQKFTWSVGREQLKNAFIQIQDSVFQTEHTYTADIDAEFLNSYSSQNVIAYLPAKKKCAKTIVFSAHYDHLGRMGEATYFPGANDNASGTAMLITMAKYFKQHPSDFNIMFIAFAGEEAGLVGSKYYSEHPYQKLKKIKFLLNLDIMGSGEEGITAVNATLFEREFAKLQTVNQKHQLLTQVKKRGPAANSDHYWFTLKGVPAFFIYTMGPNKNYHDVFDRAEALSWKEFEDITTLLTLFIDTL